MGQAKRRGTFEERKAEAIAAGRVKVERQTRSIPEWLYLKMLLSTLLLKSKGAIRLMR